jgi:hypothetical protein
MRGIIVAAWVVAGGALSLAPLTAAAETKATSSKSSNYAHAPAKHGAKPVSGGTRYKCHKPRGVAGAVGLPNCDNPHNVDNPN